jgi:glycosyltransferase involved in cell wall biosynthesis
MSYGIAADKVVPIAAFSKQYLDFEIVALNPIIEEFFENHDPVICSYVFFRPVFFIEAMVHAVAEIVKQRPGFGLIIMGSDADSEKIRGLIEELNLNEHIILAGDQDHDSFLTIMTRSKLYLRTHIKDGVCSSVLEALSLGVPVVACEDGIRPKSVITYENENVDDMAEKILFVLDNHEKTVDGIERPEIKDTTAEEIRVLGEA